MPKATLVFNLPEEQHEYNLVNNASKLAIIIDEFTNLCRERTKYATGEEKDPTWEEIRTQWWAILNEERYDPYTD